MNTISYKSLKIWYTENEAAKALANEVFGDKQPSIYRTGFYSAPSWNWGYTIGLVQVHKPSKFDSKYDEYSTYEVVTQFGSVVAARPAYIPVVVA